ncbi:hypothetical protein BJ741DRAFT_598731 [Chytriomyces cf. hyalinus JEL632]|nr:hypothetical protein BJ741DRAFT_598731 [Chytriomyces cf. hyalinus JEL632]
MDTANHAIAAIETVWLVVCLVTTALFALRWREPVLLPRAFLETYLQAISGLVAFFSGGGCSYVVAVPCAIRFWIFNVSITVWCTSLLLRFIKSFVVKRKQIHALFHPEVHAFPENTDEFGSPIKNRPDPKNVMRDASKQTLHQPTTLSAQAAEVSPGSSKRMKLCLHVMTDAWILDGCLLRYLWIPAFAVYTCLGLYLALMQFFSDELGYLVLAVDGCFSRFSAHAFSTCYGVFTFVVGGNLMIWISYHTSDQDYVLAELILTYIVGQLLGVLFVFLLVLGAFGATHQPWWWFLASLLIFSHIASIICPMVLSCCEHRAASAQSLDMNYDSFEKALQNRLLKSSLKQFADRGKPAVAGVFIDSLRVCFFVFGTLIELCGFYFNFLDALQEIKDECKAHQQDLKPGMVHHAHKSRSALDSRKSGQSNTTMVATIRADNSAVPAIPTIVIPRAMSVPEPCFLQIDQSTQLDSVSSQALQASTSVTLTRNADPERLRMHSRVSSGEMLSPVSTLHRCLRASTTQTLNLPQQESCTLFNISCLQVSRDRMQRASVATLFAANGIYTKSISTRKLPSSKTAFENHHVPLQVLHHYELVYNTYCRSGAPCELNLPYRIRMDLKELADAVAWRVGSFDEAKANVVDLMFSNIYARWVCERQPRRSM